jgi:hypothetical protein
MSVAAKGGDRRNSIDEPTEGGRQGIRAMCIKVLELVSGKVTPGSQIDSRKLCTSIGAALRRTYDVFNALEGVGLVTKLLLVPSGFRWNGAAGIRERMTVLQECAAPSDVIALLTAAYRTHTPSITKNDKRRQKQAEKAGSAVRGAGVMRPLLVMTLYFVQKEYKDNMQITRVEFHEITKKSGIALKQKTESIDRKAYDIFSLFVALGIVTSATPPGTTRTKEIYLWTPKNVMRWWEKNDNTPQSLPPLMQYQFSVEVPDTPKIDRRRERDSPKPVMTLRERTNKHSYSRCSGGEDNDDDDDKDEDYEEWEDEEYALRSRLMKKAKKNSTAAVTVMLAAASTESADSLHPWYEEEEEEDEVPLPPVMDEEEMLPPLFSDGHELLTMLDDIDPIF